jgi:hypothetical protein
MNDNRQRLAVRIFKVIEGEAEGPLAILVLFALGVLMVCAAFWLHLHT